jgi:hypothetical protein
MAVWLAQRDLLGPPSDGKVIVLSNSDEEEEVCEVTPANTDAALAAAVKSLMPAASATDADEDPEKCKMIIVMILPPTRTRVRAVAAETKPPCLRLSRQEWHL